MKHLKPLIAASFLCALAACSAVDEKSTMTDKNGMDEQKSMTSHAASTSDATMSALQSLFEVHKDNRIYVFYDKTLYADFIKMGHTAFMFTRIGAGPHGETMVFALSNEDKKKVSGIPSVELIDGLKKPAHFYGETLSDGRIYVFGEYDLMADFRNTGEAAYRYTDIGAGPNGETVVYVLSKKESKNKPEALIALFKQMQ